MALRREDARIFVEGHNFLAPILLRESVIDSVSFRAHAKHFDDQIEALDAWLTRSIRGLRDFTTAFVRLESQALDLVRNAPTFMESGIIDADYTFTAMLRFSEANNAYWQEIFQHARNMEATWSEPMMRLQQTELREVKHLRNEFYRTQKAFDDQIKQYFAQPKTKEASSLREDAFQLFEKRKAYIKASFDYVIKMSMFKSAVDQAFVQSFVRGFNNAVHHTGALASDYNSRPRLDMVTDWTNEMSKSARQCEEYLHSIRFDLEDEIIRMVSPARDLTEYQSVHTQPSGLRRAAVTTANAKQGWLLVRLVSGKPTRYTWTRRWFFVKHGVFGWLANNSKTGAVEESEHLGVLLCNVRASKQEERRFCFEVVTKDTTILLQAESDAEASAWLDVFDNVRKEAISTPESSSHASRIDKASPAFAIGSATPDEHGLDNTALSTRRMSHAKSESGGTTGLSALISAASGVATLTAPRGSISHVDQSRLDNPFDVFVDVYPLSPTTLAPSPLCTALTNQSILGNATLTDTPSAAQANFWGSVAYGMISQTASMQLDAKAMAKLLCSPDSAMYSMMSKRAREEKSLHTAPAATVAGPKEYPPDFPQEIRRQDAHFMSLFPQARNEHVLMVLRGNRTLSAYDGSFSARVYFTLRGCYLYANSHGMILVQSCMYSEMLGVRLKKRSTHDVLIFDIHDLGEAELVLYLDEGGLAKKRIEILLGNYIADEPLGCAEVFKLLRNALPSDTRVRSVSQIPNPQTAAPGPLKEAAASPVAENSDDEDADDDDAGKRIEKIDGVRLKLPNQPVAGEADDQMYGKIFDREYMVTAKGLFHLLFGNRTPVWLRSYADLGFKDVQQGPWQTIEDGTLARAYKYELTIVGSDGRTKTSEWSDFHKIWKREEHLNYVVTFYRRPFNMPDGDKFFMHVKWNITYVSKQKARLRAWIGVDWQGTNRLLRGVISQAFLQSARLVAMPTVQHFIEREALDRLGLQSKTSKAVRIYGRVIGRGDTMYLDGGGHGKGSKSGEKAANPTIRRFTAFGLARANPRVFLNSLITEASVSTWHVLNHVSAFVTTHSFLIGIIIILALSNLWLTGRATGQYWQHRRADTLLNSIDMRPFGFITHGVTVKDLDVFTYQTVSKQMEDNEIDSQPFGICYEVFRQSPLLQDDLSSNSFLPELPVKESTANDSFRLMDDFARATRKERQHLARKRHDLMVAMRLLNRMDREIVRAGWEQFVVSVAEQCAKGQSQSDSTPKFDEEFCLDCDRYIASINSGHT
ncbi:SNF1-interacting protein [Savitreella phatthalungensis]